jgi:hypothetical protein
MKDRNQTIPTRHGKHKHRICLSCEKYTTIHGGSWNWHCKNKHTEINKNEV